MQGEQFAAEPGLLFMQCEHGLVLLGKVAFQPRDSFLDPVKSFG